MKHKLVLTDKERMDIWLDLCDFTFGLMNSALNRKEVNKRFIKIREEHNKSDRAILEGLSKIST